MSNFQTRNLPFYAGQVAGQGMDKEEALKFTNILDFTENSPGACSAVYRNGWKELLSHFVTKNKPYYLLK